MKSKIDFFQEHVFDAARALRDDDYDKAISIYKKSSLEEGLEVPSFSGIAKCYEWKGDMESAVEYAEKALAIDPVESEMLMLAARYWSEKEDHHMTYKYACRIIKSLPKSLEWYTKLVVWSFWPLSLFSKKYKDAVGKIKKDFSDDKRKRLEELKWARDFKKWYESVN